MMRWKWDSRRARRNCPSHMKRRRDGMLRRCHWKWWGPRSRRRQTSSWVLLTWHWKSYKKNTKVKRFKIKLWERLALIFITFSDTFGKSYTAVVSRIYYQRTLPARSWLFLRFAWSKTPPWNLPSVQPVRYSPIYLSSVLQYNIVSPWLLISILLKNKITQYKLYVIRSLIFHNTSM